MELRTISSLASESPSLRVVAPVGAGCAAAAADPAGGPPEPTFENRSFLFELEPRVVHMSSMTLSIVTVESVLLSD